MKLRSITIGNVRRFAGQEAHLGPFSDGLTTVCAPNESGKSTFFDALHALFFAGYTTTAGEVRALQPYTGGAVRVAAEVEIDGQLYRVEKSFINRKTAKVTEVASGRVIGYEGEAEEWIKTHIQSQAVGPAGLLWVRQGMSGFGPQGASQKEKAERERLREARQELMSSVAGQIDAVTGGRRMDAIMRRCQAEIDKLVTPGLKIKASGPWGAQEAEVADLSAECERLRGLVRDLSTALADKRRLVKELGRLSDPQDEERRAESLARAKEDVRRATEHAAKIETAERDLKLMELEADKIRDDIARIDDAKARRAARDRRIAALEGTLSEAEEDLGKAEGEVTVAQENIRRAIADRDRLARCLREARKLLERRTELETLKGLKARRMQAEALHGDLAEARKVLREAPLSEKDLDAMEALERRRANSALRREAGAASFRFDYEGELRASIGAEELAGGEARAILEETCVSLPGFGCVVLSPAAEAVVGDDPEALADELESRLSSFGLVDLPAARAAVQAAARARSTEATTKAAVAAIAPEGLEALRERILRISESLDVDPAGGVPDAAATGEKVDVDGLEAQLERATRIWRRPARCPRRRRWHATRPARPRPRPAPSFASRPKGARTIRHPGTRMRSAMGSRAISPTGRRRSAGRRRPRRSARDIAGPEDRRGASEAPAERAQQRRAGKAGKERDPHELEGRIRARADDGVEEKLAEAEEALERAISRSARYKMEVDASVELRTELERAQRMRGTPISSR